MTCCGNKEGLNLLKGLLKIVQMSQVQCLNFVNVAVQQMLIYSFYSQLFFRVALAWQYLKR